MLNCFLNNSTKGNPLQPFVICVEIARCLCNPTFPPSGVSSGSIIPHCVEFNKRGPTTLALLSISKFNLRNCEIKELKERRFKS